MSEAAEVESNEARARTSCLRVTFDGTGADAARESMWDVLRTDADLRGRVRAEPIGSGPDSMGVSIELVITVSTSGVISAVVGGVTTWLRHRREPRWADVNVKITNDSGRTVIVSAQHVADPDSLVRTLLEDG